MRRSLRMPLVAAALLLAACRTDVSPPCEAGSAECIVLTIPRGATLSAAVDSLTAHQIVAPRMLFRLYARVRGLGRSLKSGIYAFRRETPWHEIVAALELGRGTLVRFTVREGLQAGEIADIAARQLQVPRDSFLTATHDSGLLELLGGSAHAESAEGYLYPTTYTIRPDLSGRELVRLMIQEFLNHWSPTWDARLDSLHMSLHDLVTLASIIQSEVRYAPDREYVSAVYHNRLRLGMLLQADPTVVYAMGRRPRRVYEKNLLIRSPYNTYLYPGLPPGPISQPDSASLAAALYPARVPFLYFVAQPDGKHIFSVSYEEHLAAIRRVKEQVQEIRERARQTRDPQPRAQRR
ncbi:MAG TPA: endolytic transglycosylase MltG [Gemmatimonadales bacterium]|nr:endolytic transglycosylase MltG [Gemmatimonadales bacterium]